MSTNPRVTANILSADTGIKLSDHKILVTGQKLSSGTATSGALQSDIITESQINTLFGRKSHIAKKLRAILKNISVSRLKPQIDAIALSDDGTAKATGTFTFTNSATENGSLVFYIDSEINGKYTVSVVIGDTPTILAGKLVDLITADTNANYTASNSAGVVTITAANAGTNGNQIGLHFEGSFSGIFENPDVINSQFCAYRALQLTQGANVSSINQGNGETQGGIRYASIPYFNIPFINLPAIKKGDTTITSITVAGVTVTKNGKNLTGGLTNPVSTSLFNAVDGIAYQTIDYPSSWDLATLYNFTEPRFNVDNAILYSHGFTFKDDTYSNLNTLLDGLNYKTITIGFNPNNFAKAEIEELISSGGYTFENNKSNTTLISREVPTTYKTNLLGDADPTFKFLNYVDTLTISREYFFNGLKQTYPRHTLTSAEQPPSKAKAFVTKGSFLATLGKFYDDLVSFGLFQGGRKKEFLQRAGETLNFDLLNGKITTSVIAPITTQLREVFLDFIPVFN